MDSRDEEENFAEESDSDDEDFVPGAEAKPGKGSTDSE